MAWIHSQLHNKPFILVSSIEIILVAYLCFYPAALFFILIERNFKNTAGDGYVVLR